MFFVESITLYGVEAAPIRVEVDISPGLPQFLIVGMPDQAVKEARERIRSAIQSCGLEFPRTRITVNLAPATLRKQGNFLDLPIAIAMLGAQGVFDLERTKNSLFCGELSLSGDVCGVSGVPSVVSYLNTVGLQGVFPEKNYEETWGSDTPHLFISHLQQIIEHLQGTTLLEPKMAAMPTCDHRGTAEDLACVKGQGAAKRALEIAAVGGHHLLLIGPPGTGKTLLAHCLQGLIPEPTREEKLEIQTVHALQKPHAAVCMGCLLHRPFRSPHHNASSAALIGGGVIPQPGEITLAHRGLLFLDELPEFSRHTLEHLRQPIEERQVTVARAQRNTTFPAACQIVAAMNPCPCGYLRHGKVSCRCTPHERDRYQNKISGPLLDRFDLFVRVAPVSATDLFTDSQSESSSAVKLRIEHAILFSREHRVQPLPNAFISTSSLSLLTPLSGAATALLQRSVDQLHLSGRAHARLRRVARSIADLAQSIQIEEEHLLEALHFRAPHGLGAL